MWVVFALLAAILWGVQYALIEKIAPRVSALVLFIWSDLIQVIGLIAFAIFTHTSCHPSPLWDKDVRWKFLVSVVVSLAAHVLIFTSIRSSGNATASSLIEISYPFFVALMSWMIFGEMRINLSTGIGGLLILAGVFFVLKGK